MRRGERSSACAVTDSDGMATSTGILRPGWREGTIVTGVALVPRHLMGRAICASIHATSRSRGRSCRRSMGRKDERRDPKCEVTKREVTHM